MIQNICFIAAFAYCVGCLIRNGLVYRFSKKLINMVYDGPGDWKARQKIFHSLSYAAMVFKFWKPLKLKAWLTEDEIKVLTGNEIEITL